MENLDQTGWFKRTPSSRVLVKLAHTLLDETPRHPPQLELAERLKVLAARTLGLSCTSDTVTTAINIAWAQRARLRQRNHAPR